jgi:hypothetical protein
MQCLLDAVRDHQVVWFVTGRRILADASVTGPPRRRMLEGASATSHADMENLLSLKGEPEEHQTIRFAEFRDRKSL